MVACALIGIVFMQVSMLKLNAGIGENVKRSVTLERENAQLRGELARLGVGARVQDSAAAKGMVVPSSGDYRVLSAGDGGSARRAVAQMTAPGTPVAWGSTLPAAASPTVVATPASTTGVTAAQTPTATTPASQVTPSATTATQPAGIVTGGGVAAPGAQG
jgi:hypothetical protein